MPVLSLQDVIAEHVRDGQLLALEGFTHLIPFAAGHEIIVVVGGFEVLQQLSGMAPQPVAGPREVLLPPVVHRQVGEDLALEVGGAVVLQGAGGHQEVARRPHLGDVVQRNRVVVRRKPFGQAAGLGDDLVGIDDDGR